MAPGLLRKNPHWTVTSQLGSLPAVLGAQEFPKDRISGVSGARVRVPFWWHNSPVLTANGDRSVCIPGRPSRFSEVW